MIAGGATGAQTFQLIGAVGVGGKPKTVAGRENAVRHFTKYLFLRKWISSEEENWSVAKKQELETKLCTPECFQAFAGYLLQATKKNGEHYDSGSIAQYISGAKNHVQNLYPTHGIWTNHASSLLSVNFNAWLTNINSTIEHEVQLRKMKEEIEEQSTFVVGTNLIKKIVQHLFEQNSSVGVERANEIVTTFTSVGRANEASYASYKTTCMVELGGRHSVRHVERGKSGT